MRPKSRNDLPSRAEELTTSQKKEPIYRQLSNIVCNSSTYLLCYCKQEHCLTYRVSARKKFMGGQLENTNLLKKKGICLLNTFLKDFNKCPLKKTLFCSLMGGDIPPCQNHEGDKSPRPPPPSVWNPDLVLRIVTRYNLYLTCLFNGNRRKHRYKHYTMFQNYIS